MTLPTSTSLTGEMRPLSIEELLAPLPQTTRLGGPGPFVINLSASGLPIALPEKSLAKSAHVFQVHRTEDGRLRYRLRLGPFADEDEADALLQSVRESYPGALTATADADDLRAIAAIQAKAGAPPSSAESRGAAGTVVTVQPANCESTQTVRPLAGLQPDELEAARWFVIQLSLAEHPFDPDTVPDLDIFGVYRLYCVAGMAQGRRVYALRLGFFSEEDAARAVASYLTAFYDQPAIKRVSPGERQRFSAQPLEPRRDVGATGNRRSSK